jgi:hypothetical protein
VSARLRALLLAAAGGVALQALHARRNWGATVEEAHAPLPRDDLMPDPAEQTTLAVTVEASAQEVWRARARRCRSRSVSASPHE